MGNIHNKAGRERGKAVERQGKHFAHGVKADLPDVFKPHLRDLPEGTRIACRTVYRLAVTKALRQGHAFLHAAHDGKRDVRLEREQLPAEVVKGEDMLLLQKTAVLCVKIVFFKLAHAELAVAILRIQGCEFQNGAFAALARCRCVHDVLRP